MPRGGSRPGAGRKKQERPVDGNVARKIKARIKAEEKWVRLCEIAAEKAETTGNTADLRNALEYLDNRDLGTCVDTVNHMHDKPMDVNLTVNLGEGMRAAMKKADERLANFRNRNK